MAMQPAIANQNGRGVWLYYSLPATASQISSLQWWTHFFADAEIRRWNASSSRIRTSQRPTCRLGHPLQPSGVDPKSLIKRENLTALLQMPKKQRGRGFEEPVTSKLTSAQCPHASPSLQREHSPVLFNQHDQRPSAAASDMIRDWPRPLAVICFMHVMTKAVNELGLEWSPPEEPSRSRLDKWILSGRHQDLHQRLSPFFPELHDELTKSWCTPYSSRIRPSASVALTSVHGAEDKGYVHLPPLDESLATHLCPPTAIGWKARASHPSKPCRSTSVLAGCAYSVAGQAASALHSMALLQVFQAKMLANEEASQGPEERDRPGSTRHKKLPPKPSGVWCPDW